MCVFIHIHTIAIRGQLSRSWFSPHVSPEDQVQVVRPGGKLLYLLSQSCQPPCSISLLKLLYYYKKKPSLAGLLLVQSINYITALRHPFEDRVGRDLNFLSATLVQVMAFILAILSIL